MNNTIHRVNTLKAILRDKQLIISGLVLAVLLFLLHWLELRFVIIDHAFEVYAGAIAVLFTLLGIWLALKLTNPQIETILVEREVFVHDLQEPELTFNEAECEELGLTSRELDVLKGMAQGMSNQEIADKLFVSLNTVKTHSSNLFEKLDVKRRTQAIEKAKKLNIIC
jgi:NarL family two-component system response regulator LiaR